MLSYIDCLNTILRPSPISKYLCLDLFAGCGGMSLGFEAAGFETIGYEKNADACNTYNANLLGVCTQASLTLYSEFPKADVLIAGPPCQPFSVNGNQLGSNDSRNGFPVCISAIEQVSPEVFVLENVRGLLAKHKWYLDAVVEQLQSLGYFISVSLLNAKNYLVPQNRERVFIVGSKRKQIDLHSPHNFLITAGMALGERATEFSETSKFLTPEMDDYIKRYEIASKCRVSRDLNLSKPSRTLTCRNLAGYTGDMLRISLGNGQRRKLEILESARLQSFPDWFQFSGHESSVFHQIGNAVPPMMAFHIANIVKADLDSV